MLPIISAVLGGVYIIGRIIYSIGHFKYPALIKAGNLLCFGPLICLQILAIWSSIAMASKAI